MSYIHKDRLLTRSCVMMTAQLVQDIFFMILDFLSVYSHYQLISVPKFLMLSTVFFSDRTLPLKWKKILFIPQISFIYNKNNKQIQLHMASLRTAFVHSYSSNSSFCPIMSTLASSLSFCFSKQKSNTFSNKSKFFKGTQSMRVGCQLEAKYKKQIQIYLSLNIQSLSQLNDTECSDFSNEDGFIHALQLEKEPEAFWEVETVKSVELSNENFYEEHNIDPNSTRSESQYRDWEDNLEQVSEVQEIEQ